MEETKKSFCFLSASAWQIIDRSTVPSLKTPFLLTLNQSFISPTTSLVTEILLLSSSATLFPNCTLKPTTEGKAMVQLLSLHMSRWWSVVIRDPTENPFSHASVACSFFCWISFCDESKPFLETLLPPIDYRWLFSSTLCRKQHQPIATMKLLAIVVLAAIPGVFGQCPSTTIHHSDWWLLHRRSPCQGLDRRIQEPMYQH